MKTGTIIYTPQEIADLRNAVANEITEGRLHLGRLSRRLHCSILTIHKHAADLLAENRMRQVGIYAPKGCKLQYPLMGELLQAAGVQVGATITARVVRKGRIVITATDPVCPSLAIQRWGKVGEVRTRSER